jgi:putative transposase
MYDYRQMTQGQQQAIVTARKRRGYPWHGPPHPGAPEAYRIVTATCYEHRSILATPERLQWFEQELLETLNVLQADCAAWCLLPNHYHVLVRIVEMSVLMRSLGQLHGRTSFRMNQEDDCRGRKVWHRCQDRCMRSEAHFYTSLNYIHHNPVKHGYVRKWQDWPFSSVHWYLQTKGRDWLLDGWRQYPVLNYGAKWDDG